MGELLRDAPVEILEVRPRNDMCLHEFVRLQLRFELNVEAEVVRLPQIGQRLGILDRQWFSEGLQRVQRYHPRRNARAKVLRKEWPERLIFPRLHVTCAPIVHQTQSKTVVNSGVDGNGGA